MDWNRRLVVVGTLAALGPLWVLRAADSDDAPILAQLADTDFPTRQRATEQLLRDERLTAAAIEGLYAKASSDEQRHRLLVVARHHLVREIMRREFEHKGRGFIGIGYQPTTWSDRSNRVRPAIAVTSTIPGFPGHAYLRTGDVIVGFEGHDVAGPHDQVAIGQAFKRLIESKRAGDKVALTLRRDGRDVVLDVHLASAGALVYDRRNGRLLPNVLKQWQRVRAALQAVEPRSSPLPLDLGPLRAGFSAGP